MFHDEKGNKLKDFRKSWNSALKSAGITRKIRFHDLKHTMLSWLEMAGASPIEIQAFTGHKSIDMVMRYAHLSPEHSDKIGQKVENLLKNDMSKAQILGTCLKKSKEIKQSGRGAAW